MSFAHTAITVRDLDRSIEFYTRWLGLELVSRREIPTNKAEIVFLKDPGNQAMLELTHWQEKKDWTEGDELDHLAYRIPDVSDLVHRVSEAGVKVAREPYSLPGSDSKLAFILDPNGIWIELIEG